MLGTVAIAGACHTARGPMEVAPPPRVESASSPSPQARGFDVESYVVDLEVDDAGRRVEGSCAVRLRVTGELVESFSFELSGLELFAALDSKGERLPARQEGTEVTVDWPGGLLDGQEEVIYLRYGGVPSSGVAFLAERRVDRADGLLTRGGPESARGWLPCVDHPAERATLELTLEMPADWQMLASGERVDSRNDGGRHTEVWRLAVPHAAHRFGFVAGRLGSIEESMEGPARWRLVPDELRAEADLSLAHTSDALAFLQTTFATPYPFPALSQAVVSGLGDDVVSFAGLVLYDSTQIGDDRWLRDGHDELASVRGLAEQWSGSFVEAADWSDAWVTSGIADYAALLWAEARGGSDALGEALYARRERALSVAQEIPLSGGRVTEMADRFGSAFRERASTRLHTLRAILGDRAFKGALQMFMNESESRPATTTAFLEVAERKSGMRLDEFRDEWIDHAGQPQLFVSWSPRRSRDSIQLDVRQQQPTQGLWPRTFHMDLVVEVRDERGTSLHPVTIQDRRERFDLNTNGGTPIGVRFDVNDAVTAKIEREWDGPECLALARRKGDSIARFEAVTALADLAVEAEKARVGGSALYVGELTDLMDRDKSDWVRARAATSLGEVAAPEARERLLSAAATDPSGRVRAAALRALAPSSADAELAEFGRRQFDAAFSWETMGAAAELVVLSDRETALPWLEQVLRQPSSGDRLSMGVLDAIVKLDSPRVRLILKDVLTDLERSPAIRAHVVGLLAKDRFRRDDNAQAVASLLETDIPGLREAAVRALASMGLGTSRRALESYYPRATTAKERRLIEASLNLRRPMSRR